MTTTGRKCRTCSDPRRAEIEDFLRAGKTLVEASQRFDLPVSTLRSHQRYHGDLTPAPAAGDPVVDDLRRQLREKMGESLRAHDYRGVAQLARERRLLLTDIRLGEVSSRSRIALPPLQTAAGERFLSALLEFFARELPERLDLAQRLLREHSG